MGELIHLEPHRTARNIIFGRAMIDRMVSRAAALTGLPVAAITGPSSNRAPAWTRYAIALVARENGRSLPQIASVFSRHHTTIMDGLVRAKKLVETDEGFAALVWHLRDEAAR